MSVDGKQHLSEVVFSDTVGFSLLEKYQTFGLSSWRTARSRREPYQESKEPGESQESESSPGALS